MFYGCELLSYIPDISNWNFSKVIDFNNMFEGCKNILYIPISFNK